MLISNIWHSGLNIPEMWLFQSDNLRYAFAFFLNFPKNSEIIMCDVKNQKSIKNQNQLSDLNQF